MSKYIAREEDDKPSDEELNIDRPKYMVNLMGLGREENSDEYQELFGDIENFPAGIKVWKMERFLPVRIPFHHIGRFYTKETYLLMYVNDEERGGKIVNIHLWIGRESSMDKSGGGAFRFSELAGYLKAMSKINEIPARISTYREDQGEESTLLKSYFDKYGGYSVVEGGSSSGFRIVEKADPEPTLFLIRNGKHSIQCMLTVDVLNVRSVYLLDAGKKIYVWKGAKSNYFDRFKATEMATQIAIKERKGRALVIQIEDGEEEQKHPTIEFWRILGISRLNSSSLLSLFLSLIPLFISPYLSLICLSFPFLSSSRAKLFLWEKASQIVERRSSDRRVSFIQDIADTEQRGSV